MTVGRDDMGSSDDPTTTDPPAARITAGRKEWIGLAVIALPCLLYAMDLTVALSCCGSPTSTGSCSRDSSSRWAPWETGSVGDGFS